MDRDPSSSVHEPRKKINSVSQGKNFQHQEQHKQHKQHRHPHQHGYETTEEEEYDTATKRGHHHPPSANTKQSTSSAFRRVMRWFKPLRSSKSKNAAKLNNNGGDFGDADGYGDWNNNNGKGGGGTDGGRRRRHQNLSLPQERYFSHQPPSAQQLQQRPPSRDLTKYLPLRVISNILAHVCPHTQDDSYESSEESMTLDGCMLCDMRDLAHCALTCKRWHDIAQNLL